MADVDVDDDNEDVSTLPDNFSDVVPISANVSGRGSPSLSGEGEEQNSASGRDTPFSGNAPEQQGRRDLRNFLGNTQISFVFERNMQISSKFT